MKTSYEETIHDAASITTKVTKVTNAANAFCAEFEDSCACIADGRRAAYRDALGVHCVGEC